MAALAEDVEGQSEQAVEAEASGRPYNVRPHVLARRPGLDPGLNWQEQQREREAAAAAKSKRKAEKDARVKQKADDAHRVAKGIKMLAMLDAEYEADNCEQQRTYFEHAEVTRGYQRQLSSTTAAADYIHIILTSSEGSGSEYQEEQDEEDLYDGDDDDEVEVSDGGDDVEGMLVAKATKLASAVKKVRCHSCEHGNAICQLLTLLKKPKTTKERVQEKRKSILGSIDDARARLTPV